MIVAFQGELGSFSEEALRACFGAQGEPLPQRTFGAAVGAVLDGVAAFAVLPVANTIVGPIRDTLDLLEESDLVVRDEIVLPIHHCLLALPGAALDRITCALSHPVALAQCTAFLQRHPFMAAVPAYDTAGAAQIVAREALSEQAAIASRAAAARHGLDILVSNIENRADNCTRFVIVSRGRHGSTQVPMPLHATAPGCCR